MLRRYLRVGDFERKKLPSVILHWFLLNSCNSSTSVKDPQNVKHTSVSSMRVRTHARTHTHTHTHTKLRPQGKVTFSQVSVCPQSASWILVHCSVPLRCGPTGMLSCYTKENIFGSRLFENFPIEPK